ncbi:radical SAM protein [Candidatus Woesearchaeota archaeon]|nr:radical SAM protein [Candidatus Woesearchaeota archaeon]
MKKVYFERAIFISWYCSLGDCTYCYMSTQKNLIEDPEKAKRSTSSLLAEAYLCKKLGWKIGNLAAGYGSYTHDSILELVKNIYEIYGKKFWLNIGVLPEKTIVALQPYLEGIYGAVETVNLDIHKKVSPNKPIAQIENMFKICDKYNLKKAMTFIVGMGETIQDFEKLKEFINKNKVDKIVFYALNPIKGTMFEKSSGPEIEYYLEWIQKTRKTFPDIQITAGPWVNRVGSVKMMLDAGANAITKFPAIKLFNSKHAKTIENEIKESNYELQGTFTKLPEINEEEIMGLSFDNSLKKGILEKVKEYVSSMHKS